LFAQKRPEFLHPTVPLMCRNKHRTLFAFTNALLESIQHMQPSILKPKWSSRHLRSPTWLAIVIVKKQLPHGIQAALVGFGVCVKNAVVGISGHLGH
jgi:hypothetical protein